MKRRNEVSEFWNNIEKENNASVDFKTYAFLFGRSSDTLLNLAGIFYVIDDKIIFENFEKRNGVFELFGKKEEFNKCKVSVLLDEVLDVREVTKTSAYKCINGYLNHLETNTISRYHRLFSKSICQIILRSDYSLFFDLLDSKEFISFFYDRGGR